MNAPVGISFFNRDLRYIRINAMMARINDVDSAAVADRPMAEVLPDVAPPVDLVKPVDVEQLRTLLARRQNFCLQQPCETMTKER